MGKLSELDLIAQELNKERQKLLDKLMSIDGIREAIQWYGFKEIEKYVKDLKKCKAELRMSRPYRKRNGGWR